jgi:hypothetical protein
MITNRRHRTLSWPEKPLESLLKIIELAQAVSFRMSQELDLPESAIASKVEREIGHQTAKEATTPPEATCGHLFDWDAAQQAPEAGLGDVPRYLDGRVFQRERAVDAHKKGLQP